MAFVVRVTPGAERVLAGMSGQRALALRQSLLDKVRQVAQLTSLRRYGDEAETEQFRLRVGSLEALYSVDRWTGTVTLHEVVRLPSTRIRSVG
jgi:hypothetical protein